VNASKHQTRKNTTRHQMQCGCECKQEEQGAARVSLLTCNDTERVLAVHEEQQPPPTSSTALGRPSSRVEREGRKEWVEERKNNGGCRGMQWGPGTAGAALGKTAAAEP